MKKICFVFILIIINSFVFSQTNKKGTITIKKTPKITFGYDCLVFKDTLFTTDIQNLAFKVDSEYKILNFKLSRIIDGYYVSSGLIKGSKIDVRNHRKIVSFDHGKKIIEIEQMKVLNLKTRRIISLPVFYLVINYPEKL